nr:MAG TPA: hypothetical protein [Caudoviricetes sp.]
MSASIYSTMLLSLLSRTHSRIWSARASNVSSSESLLLELAARPGGPVSHTDHILDQAQHQAISETLLLVHVDTMISQKSSSNPEMKLISLSTDSETSSRSTVLPPSPISTISAVSLPNTLTRTGAGLRPGTCR